MVAFAKYLPSGFRSDKDQSANPTSAPELLHPHDSNSDIDENDKKLVVDPAVADDLSLNPGGLTLEEDTAGGMGRHLGVVSCTLLIVGRIIGFVQFHCCVQLLMGRWINT
ncbi:hypothetical protein JB92DRAFT_695633 [Gautieria morchelliformis]|nr:hypothetical protein JB92DRAFT_695633 [Gautieria morchelliformis]